METKEVKKKKGLINEQFFQHQLSYHSENSRKPIDILTNWSIGTLGYVPLYDLAFRVNSSFSPGEVLSIDRPLNEFDKKYGVKGWRSHPEFAGMVTKAIKEGHYNVPLLLGVGDEQNDIKSTLSHLVGRVTGMCTGRINIRNIDTCSIPGVGGMEGMFSDICVTTNWVMHKMRRTSKEEHRPVYLANYMFLASIPDAVSVHKAVEEKTFKPLFGVMVKAENVADVKAFVLTNTAIPSSMVELWEDESVEEQGSKLKPHFRKHLKSKLAASGVTIKTFKDLGKEIIRTLKAPKFPTITAREEWLQHVLEGAYDVKEGKMIVGGDLKLSPVGNKAIQEFGEEVKALITT